MAHSEFPTSFWRGALRILLRRSLLLTLIFILLAQALSMLLLSPLTFWLINTAIRLSGTMVVANIGIVSFARSPAGIILIIVGLVGYVFVALAQLAALLIINSRAFARQPTSLYGVLRVLITRIRQLFKTALALSALVLLVALPLAALAGITYWLLLSGADINYFLSTKPPQFIAALSIAGVLVVIGLVALLIAQVRLIFVAPLVVFEGQSGFAALRASNALARGHTWRILRVLLLGLGVALALLILSSLIVSALSYLLASDASSTALSLSLAALFLGTILVSAFQAIMVPFLHAAIISYLYLDMRKRAGRNTQPELPTGVDANAHHMVNRKLRLGLVSAAVLFIAALACLVGFAAQSLLLRPKIAIMAHRAGAAGVPENSLTALHRAITQGIATYAEIDVQETADGVVMVIHDSDLRRLANVDARVWDLTLAQIEQVDIGSKVGPQFAGERIPTFEAFLDAAKGKIKLNIELKYDRNAPMLAGKVVNLVRAKGMQNEVVISSLDTDGLAQVRKLAPELKIGLIYQIEIGSIEQLDVDFLEPEASQVTDNLMSIAQARGLPVYAWTIDDATTAERMYDAGVSAVITNDPPLAQQALAERSTLSDQQLIVIRFRELLGL